MILIVDNYDSFVFNVARYFEEAGRRGRGSCATTPSTSRTIATSGATAPSCSRPVRARRARPASRSTSSGALSGTLPILGICLGHQCIGEAFGGRTEHARTPMHGRASPIEHDGTGLFAGLPTPVRGRALSLAHRRTRRGRRRSPSPPAAPTARSWRSPTASTRPSACNSTRNRSSPPHGHALDPRLPGPRLVSFLDPSHRCGARRRLSPRVGVLDRGFQLGDGVFDTMTAAAESLARRTASISPGSWRTPPPSASCSARPSSRSMQAEVLAEIAGRPAIVRTTRDARRAARGLWPAGAPEPTLARHGRSPVIPDLDRPARPARHRDSAAQPALRACRAQVARLSRQYPGRARGARRRDADDALDPQPRRPCRLHHHRQCLRACTGDPLGHPARSPTAASTAIMRAARPRGGPASASPRPRHSLTPADLIAADAVFLTNSVRLSGPSSALAMPISPALAARRCLSLGPAQRRPLQPVECPAS